MSCLSSKSFNSSPFLARESLYPLAWNLSSISPSGLSLPFQPQPLTPQAPATGSFYSILLFIHFYTL